MPHFEQLPRKVLRVAQVEDATGLSRATIYRKMNDRTFPIAVRLGDRAVGWYADEINEFNDSRSRIRVSHRASA